MKFNKEKKKESWKNKKYNMVHMLFSIKECGSIILFKIFYVLIL